MVGQKLESKIFEAIAFVLNILMADLVETVFESSGRPQTWIFVKINKKESIVIPFLSNFMVKW